MSPLALPQTVSTPVVEPTQALATLAGSQVQAAVWVPARELRMSATSSFVWVVLVNRCAMAFALPAACMGQARWLPWLADCMVADPGGRHTRYSHPSGIEATPLYAAPWNPLQTCPTPSATLRETASRFIGLLDADITRLLQGFDTHRIYASLRNYMRLAILPEPRRAHRVQALVRFPQLCAPILLTAHQGNTLDGGNRHAWRDHSDNVLAAIDQGRDLTGALATHWGISRGLVRSSVMRNMWGATGLSHRNLLRLLDGIPAHCRPADVGGLMPHQPLLAWLQGLAREGCHWPTVGQRVFARGLDAAWERLQRRHAEPLLALADTRDFCHAVDRVAENSNADAANVLYAQGTAMTWLLHFGLDDLLAASARWHRQHARLGPTAVVGIDLTAVFGTGTWRTLEVVELLTAQALVDEGDAMEHCVASYWEECSRGECRIFALRLGDERATAQCNFHPDHLAEGGQFKLAQLRGRFNANPSTQLRSLAQAFTHTLNGADCAAQRKHMTLTRARARLPDWTAPPPVSLLDVSSLSQLQTLLADIVQAHGPFAIPETAAPGNLAVAHAAGFPQVKVTEIRGFGYYDGYQVLHLLETGKPVELVREPHNPHDALAVQVQWHGVQLGYVARPDNEPVAHVLDAGHPVKAWIVQLPPDTPDWDNPILIAIETTPDAA